MNQFSEIHGTKFRPEPDYANIQKVIARELGENFVIRGAAITGHSADMESKLAMADAIVAQRAAKGLLAGIAAEYQQNPSASVGAPATTPGVEHSPARGK